MGTRLFLTKFERVQRAAQKPPLAAPRTIRGGDICEENGAACQKSPIMIEIGLLRRGGRLCPPGRVQLIFAKSCGAYVRTARFGVGGDAGHSRSRRRSVTDVGLPLAGTHRPGRMHRFYGNLRRIRNFPNGPTESSAPTEVVLITNCPLVLYRPTPFSRPAFACSGVSSDSS